MRVGTGWIGRMSLAAGALVTGGLQRASGQEDDWTAGWTEEAAEAIAAGGLAGGGLPGWVPYVIMGVLVMVLLMIFAILLIVIIAKSRAQSRLDAQRIRKAEEDRADNERRIDELQKQIENVSKDSEDRIEEDMVEDPRNLTVVYGKAKLGLFLIDKTTGVAHSLAMHKTNPDGHVTETPKYRVGKLAECDICLPEPSIGRHHCDLYANYEGSVFVFDHNSTNGTFVERGEESIRVKGECALENMDILVIGDERVGAARLRAIIEPIDG